MQRMEHIAASAARGGTMSIRSRRSTRLVTALALVITMVLGIAAPALGYSTPWSRTYIPPRGPTDPDDYFELQAECGGAGASLGNLVEGGGAGRSIGVLADSISVQMV